jgi:hypothetical protein
VARADSTVRVNIVGDASNLRGALREGEKGVTGFSGKLKAIGAGIAAAFAADAVLDFAQVALAESDRLGDATGRLQEQLGSLSDPLIANADKFADLGQSAQDMLELEARIADIGTAAGIADQSLAPMSEDAAATAAALSLLGDADAATILDSIGKAAGGSDRPLKDLGINLTDAEVAARAMADTGKTNAAALTDGELAAARLALILEKLAPRVATVTDGEADLEKRQGTLSAKWETFTGRVGQALEGPLTDLLEWILSGIDGLEHMGDFLKIVEQNFRDLLGPIARAVDILSEFVNLIREANKGADQSAFRPKGPNAPNANPLQGTQGTQGVSAFTIVVQGGSPEEIEGAVKSAVTTLERRGGL